MADTQRNDEGYSEGAGSADRASGAEGASPVQGTQAADAAASASGAASAGEPDGAAVAAAGNATTAAAGNAASAEAASSTADAAASRDSVGPDAASGTRRSGTDSDSPSASASRQTGKPHRFDGAHLRFAVGLIFLLVAGNLATWAFAQLPAQTGVFAAELAFGILFVAGAVLLASAYLRARAAEGAAVQRMVRQAYQHGMNDELQRVQSLRDQSCPVETGGTEALADRLRAAAQEQQRKRAPEVPDSIDPAERLLSRTEDTFGTLRSLVENPQTAEEYQGLRQLLLGLDLLQWDTAPQAPCRLLDRNQCFWIAAETDGLPADDYDRLLSTEAALNLAKAIHAADPQLPAASYLAAARQRLQAVYQLQDTDADVFRWLSFAYDNPAAAQATSEWGQRIAIADAAEDAPLPFRVDFSMRTNTDAGIAYIRLEVPRPACFACVAADPDARAQLAASYALRSALFMAHAAFRVPAAKQVVVSCHEHDSLRTVLSLQADADDLARLQQRAARAAGWFDDPAVRVRFTDDGWLGAVEPHLRATDDVLMPELYELPAELDGRTCDAALQKVAGASSVADFSINEDAERQYVWRAFSQDMPTSVGEAVSRLLAYKEDATQQATRDACDRAVRGLAEGSVELSDRAGIRKLLLADSELHDAVAYARRVITGDDPEAVEKAIDRLKAALSTGLEIAYLDDTDSVFRYFGSVAERVAFNREFASDVRTVQLVPDVYFNALELAARMLTLMGHNDEALSYADEAMRVAPETVDAALIKARVLENKNDIFGAADLVRRTISRVTSKHDLALCLYRMAYFEWKLGRGRLSVACYKAVIDLRTTISGQAALELAQVIAAEDSVHDMSHSQAHALLNEAGIPYQMSPVTQDWMVESAIRCVDARIFPTAASLVGSLVEVMRDDALVDMYKSVHV